MRYIYLKILLAFALIISIQTTIAQTIWQQKTSLPAVGRDCATSFTVGQKGYVIGGGYPMNTALNEVWEFNPSTNSWTQKASIPIGRNRASAFTIGSKGYVVGGHNGSTFLNDLWEYDPATNVWTQKASFPGAPRFAATAFSVNGKGYYGTGSTQSTYFGDFWEYNPLTNTWTEIAALPSSPRNGSRSFVIGTKAYVSCGSSGGTFFNELWEYTAATNTWLQKASLPFSVRRAYHVAFSVGGKGYIATGLTPASRMQDVWEYDVSTNIWQQKANFAGNARLDALAMTINNIVYVGTGYSGIYQNDLWQYSPCSENIPSITIYNTNSQVCENGSAVFNASISNAGNTPWLIWKKNGSVVSNGSQLSVTISNLHNNDKITCQLLGPAPCSTLVNSNEINVLTSTISPSVSISSNVNSVCEGGTALFTAIPVNGGTAPYFYWKVDGSIVAQGTQNSAQIYYPYDDAVVTCEMTSNDPCSSPATVTSNGVTLTIITVTAKAGVNETIIGNSVNLYGNQPANGETGSWTIISGGGTLVNPSQHDSKFMGTAGQSYELKWTVTNPQCGIAEDEVTISFSAPPSPNSGKLWGMTKDGGTHGLGVIYEYDALTETLVKKYDFESEIMGRNPWGSLVQAYNGKLYGLATDGGIDQGGTLFEFDPVTSTYTKKHDLNNSLGLYPTGALVKGPGGKLFGLTKMGGNADRGTIFSYDPETNVITKLYDFTSSDGKEPVASLFYYDGYLYGTTEFGGAYNLGTVFRYSPGSTGIEILNHFNGTDGATPGGSLIVKDGYLYGTTLLGGTHNKGVIFEIDPGLIGFTKKLDLGEGNPYGDLVDFNGRFYGLGPNDGVNNKGVLFSYIPNGPGLYGGGIPASYIFNGMDGATPRGSLKLFNNRLYGVTHFGGSLNKGVLFEYHPGNHVLRKKIDFDNSNGALPEFSTLIELEEVPPANISSNTTIICPGAEVTLTENPATSGNTYQWYVDGVSILGATSSSYNATQTGSYHLKVTNPTGYYSISNSIVLTEVVASDAGQDKIVKGNYTYLDASEDQPGTGTWSIVNGIGGVIVEPSNIHSKFRGSMGQTYTLKWTINNPSCPSTEDEVMIEFNPLPFPYTGRLFGTTTEGGQHDKGVIYEYDILTETYTKKFDFNGSNGASPQGAMVQARNGRFYGTTLVGGVQDWGTIFEYDPITNNFSKKFDFSGANGMLPYATLLHASDGKLYGTTRAGGSTSDGVIFSFDPETSQYNLLHQFNGTQGSGPFATLYENNGELFGTTAFGGGLNKGGLFSYNINSQTFLWLSDLDSRPRGAVTKMNNRIYGLTSEGGVNNAGTIFEFDPEGLGQPATSIYDLNPAGRLPLGDLFTLDGEFYILLSEGGQYNFGSALRLKYENNTRHITPLHQFRVEDGMFPRGTLMQASNDLLFGTTHLGGQNGDAGTLFELDHALRVFGKIYQFNPVNGNQPEYSNLVELKEVPVAQIGGPSTVCLYDEITLSEYPQTTGNTYQWQKDGVNIPGATSSSYAVTETGDYRLKITNAANLYSISNTIHVAQGVVATAGGNRIVPGTHTYIRGGEEPTGVWSIISGTGGSLQLLGSGDAKLRGTIGETYTLRYAVSNSSCSAFDDTEISFIELPHLYTGILYGMTNSGGTNGGGVIYEYNTLTETYTVKYNFDCSTGGCNPYGSLLQTKNGKLFGMTAVGGQYGKGVIFEFNPTTNQYINRHFFFNDNGEHPQGSLLEGADGKLYGLTTLGGNNGKGVLFAYDPENMSLTVKHHFDGLTGANPNGTLTLAANGHMYGTTVNGGSTNSGNMFDFDPVTGNLVSITDLEKHPRGSVVKISSDTWRGLTSQGGADNAGMLYEFNDLNYFSREINMTSFGSRKPTGDLTESNGTHFGLASEGGEFGYGNIFAIQFLGNSIGYPSPYQLTLNDGIKPMGSLLKASNNILYGVTSAGGANGFGTFFEYDHQVSLFHKEVDFSFSLGGNPQYSTLIELLQVPIAGIIAQTSPHLCNGNSVVLTEYPLTTGNFYQWYKDGVALAGAINQTYTATTAGMYKLKVTNSADMYAVSGGIYVTVSNTTGTASAGAILCYGGTTTLTATASGGTAPYTYALNGNSPQASNTFTVPAGTYTIQITDYYGCASNTNTVIITQPSPLSVSGTFTPILCFGNLSQITLTGTGGTGAYQYKIATPSYQSSNLFSRPAGTWTPEIKDANGCMASGSVLSITQPTPVQVMIPPAFTVNPGGNPFTIYQGYGPSSITLTPIPSGGVGGYSFKWGINTFSGQPYSNSQNLTVSPTQNTNYHLLVKDANGCQKGIVQTVSLVDVRCGPNLNKIEICQPRNNGSFVTNCVNASSVPNYLNSGSKLGACPTITRNESPEQIQENITWNVKVLPNPSNTEFTLLVDSPSEELLNIIITDMAGRQVQRVSAVPNSPFKIGANYITGVYIATVMQSGKQKTIKLVKIN